MRFYVSPADWPAEAEAVSLDESEARHASVVMRVRVGERVEVFDGCGRVATAVVAAAGKRAVELTLSETRLAPAAGSRLVLAVAIPKGATMEWILEKAVELGATEVAPLLTQRTVVRLARDERHDRQIKWQRVAVEAAKQCGQNWLPTVHPPRTVADALTALPPMDFSWPLVASLQPSARPFREVLGLPAGGGAVPARHAAIWIGPEGDFTPEEDAALRAAGLRPVTLGPIILRVETAALYCLSVLRFCAQG